MRPVYKKQPTPGIGEPLATSTPKVANSGLTQRRVGGAANGVNGAARKEEKRGKQVDEKPVVSQKASSSLGGRVINLVFLMGLLLLTLVFTAIVLFERQESATFVESKPWLMDVRRAYYEPIKEVAMQKYNEVFAR